MGLLERYATTFHLSFSQLLGVGFFWQLGIIVLQVLFKVKMPQTRNFETFCLTPIYIYICGIPVRYIIIAICHDCLPTPSLWIGKCHESWQYIYIYPFLGTKSSLYCGSFFWGGIIQKRCFLTSEMYEMLLNILRENYHPNCRISLNFHEHELHGHLGLQLREVDGKLRNHTA